MCEFHLTFENKFYTDEIFFLCFPPVAPLLHKKKRPICADQRDNQDRNEIFPRVISFSLTAAMHLA
jgi:hypothetical protein